MKCRLWIPLLVALGVGCYFAFVSGPSEPRYDGRKLSYWLRIAPNDETLELEEIEHANQVRERVGPEAVPWLVWKIDRTNYSWVFDSQWLEPIYRYSYRLDRYRDEHRWLRMRALDLLKQLGAPKSAIPVLVRAASADNDFVVSGILGSLLPDSLPALVRMTKDHSEKVRRVAIYAPQFSTRHALSAEVRSQMIDLLAEALNDPAVDVRSASAHQLAAYWGVGYGSAFRAERPELTKEQATMLKRAKGQIVRALRDSEASVRSNAREIWLRAGADATSDVSTIVGWLSDPDPAIRRDLATCLGELAAVHLSPDLVVDALRALADDPDPECRLSAALALKAYGLPAANVVDRLIGDLQSPNAGTRFEALSSLGKIGMPFAERALPKMLDALESAGGFGPYPASLQAAFKPFGEEAVDLMIERLTRALAHPDARTRRDAVAALLGQKSRAAPVAVPALAAALRRSDLAREEIAPMARAIEQMDTEGMPYLSEALSHPDAKIRLAIIEALECRDLKVEAALRTRAEDPDHAVWMAVRVCLEGLSERSARQALRQK